MLKGYDPILQREWTLTHIQTWARLEGPIYMHYSYKDIHIGYVPDGVKGTTRKMYADIMLKTPIVTAGLPTIIPKRSTIFCELTENDSSNYPF